MQDQFYEGQVLQGMIATYYHDRGYGFVRPDGARNDLFVHISDVPGRNELDLGQRVEFVVDRDLRSGRLRATEVRVLDGEAEQQPAA